MLRIGSTVMGVEDLRRAVAFWTQALDYIPKREIPADDDFAILVPASGPGAHLALDVSETPVQQHPRVHPDLYAGDAADQAAEVDRLISLGATRVDWDLYPEDPDFIVLANRRGGSLAFDYIPSQARRASRNSILASTPCSYEHTLVRARAVGLPAGR